MKWPKKRRAMRWAGLCCLAIAAITAAASLGGRAAWAEALVADLSSHLVAITTGFHGTEVLLFGATDGEGDVVVVVRGPKRPVIVRKKTRIAGLWVNSDEMEFTEVPAFFHMASSRPIGEFVPPALRSRHRLGVNFIELTPAGAETDGDDALPPGALLKEEKRVSVFRAALITEEQRLARYGAKDGKVFFLGERLFRTMVTFPPDVPTGTYDVEVFFFRDREVVGAQTTPLIISKVGLGAEIFDFAHQHSILYGIFSVILALLAGWLAAVAFRRM